MGSITTQTDVAGDGNWTNHPMIDHVRNLGPLIDDLAPRIEREGRLPTELTDRLTAAEVFQMFLPASLGGPEVHPLTGFSVCEELARHDGSVGWCAQVSAAVTIFLAWLDPDALAEMVAITNGPLHVAGSARPLGTAIAAGDGYRVTGQWNFASGVRHANWFLATSFVERPDRPPAARSMLIPVGDGEIVDNWDVVGMRRTGSDDFMLDDVFVPANRVGSGRWVAQRREPLYDPRLNMVATWAPTAGVAVGLAQGALDALVAVGDLTSAGSTAPLKERSNVQEAVARAESITSATRAFVVEAIEEAWSELADDSPGLLRAVARAQLAITHSLNEAVRVADLCFHAAGTNAISKANRLERYLRDAHTAVQHAAGQPIHNQVAGRVLLGLEAGPIDPNRDGPSTPRS
jgi:alkylation response protein AidB-like acyl-CoA dehydrogenase